MMQPDMKQFLDFVESQPPALKYTYDMANICACGQFASTIGIHNGDWLRIEAAGFYRFWWDVDHLASFLPHNFGALAKRVRRQVESRPPLLK